MSFLQYGDLNQSYSGETRTMFRGEIANDKWKLTPKEEKIHLLISMFNKKQAVEEMKKFYQQIGESLLLGEEKTITPLQEPDFRYLDFLLKIREQIFALKQKYGELCVVNEALYEEINKLNKLTENLMKQTEEYNRTVLLFYLDKENVADPFKDDHTSIKQQEVLINNTVDKQIVNIRTIMEKQSKTAQENELQMIKILEMTNYLKNIITVPPEELKMQPEKEETDSKLATKAVCVICATRSVEYCLSDCGHCFCENCTNNIKTNCHVCRTPKSKHIRIYYD